ncbi:hypothetical protein [Clostridium tagluense]|uniref:Uncharacterized protein n=1 Tax=Clostridium tagluense TaxID=360422 RepID=A0A401UTS0_9CLOT|nr:hypothetical protein [Clostridium tagluense]GCD12906.1 hypothetical protein Ctaglu_45290 [Clostridium tagluense]
MKILRKAHEGNDWQETTLENFIESVKITRDIILEMNIKDRNADYYTEGFALDLLKNGNIIDTPVTLFKLGEDKDTNKCPICNKYYIGMGSLSRRDNKTDICSECGMREAMEDMTKNI